MFVRRIELQQAGDLSRLCREIYVETYPYLWDDAGEWYMQTRYNTEQLSREVSHPNVAYYFVGLEERPLGHLKVNLDSSMTAGNTQSYGDTQTRLYDPAFAQMMNQKNGLELERIYFLKQATGKGFGQKTLDFVFELARHRQKDYVWLHVMDSSPAQAFYEKNGFAVCGETMLTFEQMKPQYRRMLKMWKAL